jgi:selenocysteine lyase/cysteine desulfurase
LIEHHSNLLPWRETGSEIVYINEGEDANVDLEDLESKLRMHSSSNKIKIGCFSAASNVTGQLTDTIKISILLHKYNAHAFWDYSAAAPYVEINMNPVIKTEQLVRIQKETLKFLKKNK